MVQMKVILEIFDPNCLKNSPGCRQKLFEKGLKALIAQVGESNEVMQSAKFKAQAWTKEHPKAFFCPD